MKLAFTLVFHMYTLNSRNRLWKQVLQSKGGNSPEVLLKNVVLKKLSKFTGENLQLSR